MIDEPARCMTARHILDHRARIAHNGAVMDTWVARSCQLNEAVRHQTEVKLVKRMRKTHDG